MFSERVGAGTNLNTLMAFNSTGEKVGPILRSFRIRERKTTNGRQFRKSMRNWFHWKGTGRFKDASHTFQRTSGPIVEKNVFYLIDKNLKMRFLRPHFRFFPFINTCTRAVRSARDRHGKRPSDPFQMAKRSDRSLVPDSRVRTICVGPGHTQT